MHVKSGVRHRTPSFTSKILPRIILLTTTLTVSADSDAYNYFAHYTNTLTFWNQWSDWTNCELGCQEHGNPVENHEKHRTRTCVNGEIGDEGCEGGQSQSTNCGNFECPAPCTKTGIKLNGVSPAEITLGSFSGGEIPEITICLRVSGAQQSRKIFSYENLSLEQKFDKAGNKNSAVLMLNGQVLSENHLEQSSNFYCIEYQKNKNAKFYVNTALWYDEPVDSDWNLIWGHSLKINAVNSVVNDVSVTGNAKVLQFYQSSWHSGKTCVFSTDSYTLEHAKGDFEKITDLSNWGQWTECSSSCGNSGRKYRYRSEVHDFQRFSECNRHSCGTGWGDWSEWSSCSVNCGEGGEESRVRVCNGRSETDCRGDSLEKRDCKNSAICEKCGYSGWAFPEMQSTSNYLVSKKHLREMNENTICFEITSPFDHIKGGVYSYSLGMLSPKGNEWLLLGADTTTSDLRLYRKDARFTIPTSGLIKPGKPTRFCISSRVQHKMLYVNVNINGEEVLSEKESTKDKVAIRGGGELVIGQDQDCLMGCFNSTQAFVGKIENFMVFGSLIGGESQKRADFCPDTPAFSLSKNDAMVYGKVDFIAKWGEWSNWKSCSCSGHFETRTRQCLGGAVGSKNCVGITVETKPCETPVLGCGVVKIEPKCAKFSKVLTGTPAVVNIGTANSFSKGFTACFVFDENTKGIFGFSLFTNNRKRFQSKLIINELVCMVVVPGRKRGKASVGYYGKSGALDSSMVTWYPNGINKLIIEPVSGTLEVLEIFNHVKPIVELMEIIKSGCVSKGLLSANPKLSGSSISSFSVSSKVNSASNTEWSECSARCGSNGLQTRAIGENIETRSCNQKICPEWSQWSDWTACSATCGTGFQQKLRTCYNSENGDCSGDSQITKECINEGNECADPYGFPWKCGQVDLEERLHVRIVGGKESRPGEFPWICILEIRGDPLCGSAIIAPKWVIGASHCINSDADKPKDMRLLCGKFDRAKTESHAQVGQVSTYYKHPEYDPTTIDYDLALFEMEKEFKFNSYVRPICLPPAYDTKKAGTVCKIAGWGSVTAVKPGQFSWHVQMAPRLMTVAVPIIEPSICATFYRDQFSRRMFCAGYVEGGRDACQGDSGGPISCPVGEEGRWQLGGVVSWGIGCAQERLPGVYTKISLIMPWILGYIKSSKAEQTVPGCSSTPTVLSGPAGRVSSPNYDSKTSYSDNLNCNWKLELQPNKGAMILDFSEFDLQNSPNCQNDAVIISENLPDGSESKIGEFCGKSRPAPIMTGKGYNGFVPTVNLRFRSNKDEVSENLGFKASWTKSRNKDVDNGCGQYGKLTVNSDVHVYQSRNYPDSGSLAQRCEAELKTSFSKKRGKRDAGEYSYDGDYDYYNGTERKAGGSSASKITLIGIQLEKPLSNDCCRRLAVYKRLPPSPKTALSNKQICAGSVFVFNKRTLTWIWDHKGGADCTFRMRVTGCGTKQECEDRLNSEKVVAIGGSSKKKNGGSTRTIKQEKTEVESQNNCIFNFQEPMGVMGQSVPNKNKVDTVLPIRDLKKKDVEKFDDLVFRGKRDLKSQVRENKRSKRKQVMSLQDQQCVATLIDFTKSLILTSGVCGKRFSRRPGAIVLSNQTMVPISRCFVHPKFSPIDDSTHNIAICELSNSPDLGNSVVPACLDFESSSNFEAVPGDVVMSQNLYNLNTGERETEIQKTWLPVASAKDWDDVAEFNNRVYAGFSGGNDKLCMKESGSPVFIHGDGNSLQLYGLVSSQSGCSKHLPITTVNGYVDWIQEITEIVNGDSKNDDLDNVKKSVRKLTSENLCQPETILLDERCTPQKFSSPNYPSRYPANSFCEWKVIAPENKQVLFNFTKFDVEQGHRKCKEGDRVTVLDEMAKTTKSSFRAMCNGQMSSLVRSSGREVKLRFDSDARVQARGFECEVSC